MITGQETGHNIRDQVGTCKGLSSPLQINETRIEEGFCLRDCKISDAWLP